MDTKRMRRTLAAATLATALVGGGYLFSAPAAVAKDGARAVDTDAAALAQADALAPLRALADALGEQGRGSFADTYSNLFIDQAHHQVVLYATDKARAAALVKAAKKAHPGIDTGLERTVGARFTKTAIDAQLAAIVAAHPATTAADITIDSAAAAPDGSGILVTATPHGMAALKTEMTAMTAKTAIPVTVTAGSPITAMSWRWNDGRPEIGGDVLLGNARGGGRAQCTAGLAAEDSNGRDYLITADHCFTTGSGAYGEGDAVGNFGFTFGSQFGTVTSDQNVEFDSEAIDTGLYNGAGSNSDEADQPQGKWYAVNSYAYSYNGDSVCQDGARSYYTGHGVPCGIVVNNQDIYYSYVWDDGSAHTSRGVSGTAGYAVTQGDSGALVFTINGSSTRQARGQVSAESNGGSTLYWVEATDIFNHLGLHLNPHQ